MWIIPNFVTKTVGITLKSRIRAHSHSERTGDGTPTSNPEVVFHLLKTHVIDDIIAEGEAAIRPPVSKIQLIRLGFL